MFGRVSTAVVRGAGGSSPSAKRDASREKLLLVIK